MMKGWMVMHISSLLGEIVLLIPWQLEWLHCVDKIIQLLISRIKPYIDPYV